MSGSFYFGKIPGRGDFIRSSQHAPVVAQLDAWVTRAMERLLDDPDWKRRYDAAPAIPFLFTGTRARHAIAGRICVSHDASQRRFPLLLGNVLPVEDPLPFLACAPLCLAPTWARQTRQQTELMTAETPQAALAGIDRAAPDRYDVPAAERQLREFIEQHSLATLAARFEACAPAVDLRRSLLALGILLQPLLRAAPPEQGRRLSCPLPPDPLDAACMAAYWMDLVTPFLARLPIEVGLLMTQGTRGPALTISFGGAQPQALEAIWRHCEAGTPTVDLRDAAWVDDHLSDATGLQKLAGYLQQDSLSLSRATHTFRETFLGH